MITKQRELTASEITAEALLILKAWQYRVRKTHNVSPYRGRKNQVEKGWVDINGFCKSTGRVVMCEVKTVGDRMRPEQKELLLDCKKSGGVALVAIQGIGGVEIIDIEEYLK